MLTPQHETLTIMKELKIFEFNYENGKVKEWVYASDEQDAVDCFTKESGDPNETVRERHVITVLPRDTWKDFQILDPDEIEPDPDEVEYNEDDYCSGYKIAGTFEDLVKDHSKAFFMTSTEWEM